MSVWINKYAEVDIINGPAGTTIILDGLRIYGPKTLGVEKDVKTFKIESERLYSVFLGTAKTRLAEKEKELADLKDWQNTILNCPPEARQSAIQRMADSGVIKPIIQSWKDKVAEQEKDLAEANRTITAMHTAMQRYIKGR